MPVGNNLGPDSGSTSLRSPEPVPVSALSGNDPGQGRIKRLAKNFGVLALCFLVPIGLLNTAYHMGRDSGYRKGSTDMRDAIMCVLERTAGERPQYCPKLKYARATQSTGETK